MKTLYFLLSIFVNVIGDVYMTKTDEFIELYKKLEQIAINNYGFTNDRANSAISQLKNLKEFKSIKSEISYCQEVRNLLQHNEKIQGKYAVIPSDEMIELLNNTIDKIENPKRARHICININDVFYQSIDDYVLPGMKVMQEKSYTHIPIIDNGIVISVFSDNTIMSYLLKDEIVGIDELTTFRDFEEFLPLDNHASEIFKFVKIDALVSDISNIFEEELKMQKRIGMMFVTQDGKAQQKLMGIITPWDIAGIY